MTIAELFVKIGITGSNESKKELKGITDKISDISASSLAAKAAILGVLYGLQRLTSEAGKSGTSLIQFATLTGLSIEQLQKYEYAMLQGGGTAADFRSGISSLQDAMTGMVKLGKDAPEGFSTFEKVVGYDRSKANDMFYTIDKLQEFSRSNKIGPDVAKSMMKSFGLNENLISSMMQGVFNKKNFDAAPIYSMKEAMSLKGIDRGWANLGNDMEHGMGKIISKFGPGFIKDLRGVVKEVLKLGEAFAQLAADTDFLKGLGELFGGIADAIKTTTIMVNAMGGIFGNKEMEKNAKKSIDKYNKSEKNDSGIDMEAIHKKAVESYKLNHPEMVAPKLPAIPDSKQSVQNINVNQNLNFKHEGKEHKKTGDSVKKAVEGAFLQMPSQSQVV